MSKILLSLSALFLLVSSGLSFINKGKLADSMTDARNAHSTVASAQADATKAHVALTKSLAEVKAANQQAADAQTQTTGLKSQVTELQGKIDTATAAVAAKDKQLSELNDKLAKVGNTSTGQAVDPGAIAKEIDDLKHQRDEGVVVMEGLKDQLKSAQTQVAALTKESLARSTGASMNGLRGRVLAVDRNWNFVVIDLGDSKGVNNNATMIIQRGGSLVGKVKITSVEPSQSIADIIPNSVPPGVSVQAGDTVVFPGT